jgi:hypothetical protein
MRFRSRVTSLAIFCTAVLLAGFALASDGYTVGCCGAWLNLGSGQTCGWCDNVLNNDGRTAYIPANSCGEIQNTLQYGQPNMGVYGCSCVWSGFQNYTRCCDGDVGGCYGPSGGQQGRTGCESRTDGQPYVWTCP